MTARLFGRQMHPVYGTAWMVLHAEEAGRLLIEPHLRAGEDAVGYRIDMTHERPARVGDRLTVTARVISIDDRSCLAAIEVHRPDGRIGRGTFEQRYVTKREGDG